MKTLLRQQVLRAAGADIRNTEGHAGCNKKINSLVAGSSEPQYGSQCFVRVRGFVQKYSDQGFRAKILVSDSRQVLLCVIQSCAMVN